MVGGRTPYHFGTSIPSIATVAKSSSTAPVRMYQALLLCALMAYAAAGIHYAPSHEIQYEPAQEGHQYADYGQNIEDKGHHYEIHAKPHPYAFGYDVKDHHGGTQWRREEGDEHGTKKGAYGYTDAHGIYRQVEYIADHHGFRAKIKTNEPGTANQKPAHVELKAEEPPIKYEHYEQSHEQPKILYKVPVEHEQQAYVYADSNQHHY